MNADEKYGIRKILKNILYFLVIPFVILVLGYDLYDYLIPLDALVKVKEISPNAHTRFKIGTFTIYYGDTSVTETIRVGKYVNGIDKKYKKKIVPISFRAEGYIPLDTQVVMDKVITLHIQRDNRLTHLNGMLKNDKGLPVESALVRIKNNMVHTDNAGRFSLDIDSATQQFTQNVYFSKLGYNSEVFSINLLKGTAEEVRMTATLHKLTSKQKRLLRIKKKQPETKQGHNKIK